MKRIQASIKFDLNEEHRHLEILSLMLCTKLLEIAPNLLYEENLLIYLFM